MISCNFVSRICAAACYIFLACAAGSAASTQNPAKGSAAKPSGGARIVFEQQSGNLGEVTTFYSATAAVVPRNEGLVTQIAVVDADGSHLASLHIVGSDPSFSPDGSRIVYVARQKLEFVQVFVADADGSRQQQLTKLTLGDAASPAWSPDGKQIAFTVYAHWHPDRDPQIWVMNEDGTNLRKLAEHGSAPAWSPDSRQIAFVSDQSGHFQIYVMNADGLNVRQLTRDRSEDSSPAWAPDGASIAFVADREGHHTLYLMDPKGNEEHGLAYSKEQEFCFPAWSPDGSKLAFTAVHLAGPQFRVSGEERPACEQMTGEYQIFYMAADGSVHLVTGSKVAGLRPRFGRSAAGN